MRFILGGGGTGGHIYPAIAIAEELKRRGHDVMFIGNRDSMESRLVPASGFVFKAINVQKLYRKVTWLHVKFPFLFLGSLLKSLSIMRAFRADAVICTGGFVSGPIALAAAMKSRPLYFWDGNSYPGLTTRLFSRYIKAVFVAFDSTAKYLRHTDAVNYWIPVRDEFLTPHPRDHQAMGLSPDKPIIFVTGGSQGSKAINEAVAGSVSGILGSGYQLIWQTGKAQAEHYQKQFSGMQGIYIFGFDPDIPGIMQISRMAITRSGAMTLAELQAAKLPAILIPLPTAAENHQYYNALDQEKKGVAHLLEQSSLSPVKLMESIRKVEKEYLNYKKALEAIPLVNVAGAITDYVMKDITTKES